MTIKEILSITKHRPWEIPSEPWKYYQEWNNAVFLHWQVALPELEKLVPNELEIDLYEGKPWVSLVAFTMQKIRPKYLPAFSPISDFDEINIRTYVKKEGKTGVYFLSIEGGNRLSCKIAKSLSELPYRHSKMNRQETTYSSVNRPFNDKMNLRYSIGRELEEKSGLDKWLTERYVLFQDTVTAINQFEIHHMEGPLHTLEIKNIEIDYPRFNRLLSHLPDSKHYSTGVQVIAWDKKRIEK
jgi:uncharacterized protein